MSTEFKLPELGENVEKGDVVRVLVKPGDTVAIDQAVLELETDKATIEVPSSVAGKILDVRVKVGDKVKVGQVVLTVDAAGASAPSQAEGATAPAQPEAAAGAAAVPEAEEEQPPAPPTGRPSYKPGSVVDISAGRAAQPARVEQPTASRGEPATAASLLSREGVGIELAPPVPAAPSVRKFARELGLDIGRVTGTGPGGRIGPDDVKLHVKAMMAGGSGFEAGQDAPLPDFSKWGEVEVRPMSNIRRATAHHLGLAWRAPHVTQLDKADITALEEFRRSHGPRVEKNGGKLTVTAILIKVVAVALQRFPQFASSLDLRNDSVVYKKYCHVGVAVDTPNGLLVPVIRDADRKTVTQIAADLAGLSQKARDKKLGLDEMAGGVFSISNLGGIGGTGFTPIVNHPEVAILGVSRSATEPVWVPSTPPGAGGQFVPRDMMPLSLSYDHRVIDGADAARFLRFIAEGLEQPMSLFL